MAIRICHLLVGYTLGGVERQLLGVVPFLKEKGYEITVCALKGRGPLAEEFRARGVEAHWLGGSGKWDLRVVFRLYRFFRRKRFTIVHSYTRLANLAGGLAGKGARVPILVFSDRDLHHRSDRIEAWLQRIFRKPGNYTTMPSEAIKAFDIQRLSYPAETLVIIPNGVFTDGLPSPRRSDGLNPKLPYLVGYVGRMEEPIKGGMVLLQALAILRLTLEEYQAVFIGDGRDRARLEEVSIQLGLHGKVSFLGEKKNPLPFMANLDLLVVPSLAEGSPNVVLEAMALGVPVLASHVGGIEELIQHRVTGWLVPPGDPGELAQAIRLLLTEREMALEMAKRARDWVIQFRSLNVTSLYWLRFYEILLRNFPQERRKVLP